MDSRKPLTAGEIEELKQLCADYANPACGVVDADVWQAFQALPRLLSMLEATDTALVMDDGGSVPPLPTPPPDAAVREAVERLDNSEYTISLDGSQDDTKQMWEDIDTLIAHARAVQAPRLTGEQMEAVKIAETLLTDTMSDYGDCEHDVGHCICKYHSGVFNLRAAFPEAFEGEG